jgi:hypothetical protein
MATRSETYRAQKQREANPPKPKRAPRGRRDEPIDTSLPGVSASDRKVGAGHTASRNASKRAAEKGGAALESSATGKPSRKSTRRSTGRAKRTANLARRATRKTRSPEVRAAKAKARSPGKAKMAAADQ